MRLNDIPTGPTEAIAKCTRQRGGALSHFPGARVRPFRPFRFGRSQLARWVRRDAGRGRGRRRRGLPRTSFSWRCSRWPSASCSSGGASGSASSAASSPASSSAAGASGSASSAASGSAAAGAAAASAVRASLSALATAAGSPPPRRERRRRPAAEGDVGTSGATTTDCVPLVPVNRRRPRPPGSSPGRFAAAPGAGGRWAGARCGRTPPAR